MTALRYSLEIGGLQDGTTSQAVHVTPYGMYDRNCEEYVLQSLTEESLATHCDFFHNCRAFILAMEEILLSRWAGGDRANAPCWRCAHDDAPTTCARFFAEVQSGAYRKAPSRLSSCRIMSGEPPFHYRATTPCSDATEPTEADDSRQPPCTLPNPAGAEGSGIAAACCLSDVPLPVILYRLLCHSKVSIECYPMTIALLDRLLATMMRSVPVGRGNSGSRCGSVRLNSGRPPASSPDGLGTVTPGMRDTSTPLSPGSLPLSDAKLRSTADSWSSTQMISGSESDGDGGYFSPRTLPLLFVAALMVMAKVHDDSFRCNAFYASLLGVPLETLNQMELVLLEEVGFDAFVSHDTYVQSEFLVLQTMQVIQRERRSPLSVSTRPLSATGTPPLVVHYVLPGPSRGHTMRATATPVSNKLGHAARSSLSSYCRGGVVTTPGLVEWPRSVATPLREETRGVGGGALHPTPPPLVAPPSIVIVAEDTFSLTHSPLPSWMLAEERSSSYDASCCSVTHSSMPSPGSFFTPLIESSSTKGGRSGMNFLTAFHTPLPHSRPGEQQLLPSVYSYARRSKHAPPSDRHIDLTPTWSSNPSTATTFLTPPSQCAAVALSSTRTLSMCSITRSPRWISPNVRLELVDPA